MTNESSVDLGEKHLKAKEARKAREERRAVISIRSPIFLRNLRYIQNIFQCFEEMGLLRLSFIFDTGGLYQRDHHKQDNRLFTPYVLHDGYYVFTSRIHFRSNLGTIHENAIDAILEVIADGEQEGWNTMYSQLLTILFAASD